MMLRTTSRFLGAVATPRTNLWLLPLVLLLPSTALAHDPAGFGRILITTGIVIHLGASLLLSALAAALLRTKRSRFAVFGRTFLVTLLGAPVPPVLLIAIPHLDSDGVFIFSYFVSLLVVALAGRFWAKR